MSIAARFWLHTITKTASGHATVKLNPALRGEENKAWAAATPTGLIEMGIGNPAAIAWFEERLGRDIAVTFDDRPEDELA